MVETHLERLAARALAELPQYGYIACRVGEEHRHDKISAVMSGVAVLRKVTRPFRSLFQSVAFIYHVFLTTTPTTTTTTPPPTTTAATTFASAVTAAFAVFNNCLLRSSLVFPPPSSRFEWF